MRVARNIVSTAAVLSPALDHNGCHLIHAAHQMFFLIPGNAPAAAAA
jgi:hypothetical protein